MEADRASEKWEGLYLRRLGALNLSRRKPLTNLFPRRRCAEGIANSFDILFDAYAPAAFCTLCNLRSLIQVWRGEDRRQGSKKHSGRIRHFRRIVWIWQVCRGFERHGGNASDFPRESGAAAMRRPCRCIYSAHVLLNLHF